MVGICMTEISPPSIRLAVDRILARLRYDVVDSGYKLGLLIKPFCKLNTIKQYLNIRMVDSK